MVHFIIGSTLGGSEYVAEQLQDLLQEHQIESQLHYRPSLDQIPTQGVWILVTATHGAGEFPDNIQPFIQALQATPPKTDQLQFLVVAIGDSSYDTFCAAGKYAYQLLQDYGATPLAELFTIDIQQHSLPEDAALAWLTPLLPLLLNKG